MYGVFCNLNVRTFSRAVVIPFMKAKTGKNALLKSLNLQSRMKEILPEFLRSVGVIIEIGNDLLRMRDDPLFQEVVDTIEQVEDVDLRTQLNFFFTVQLRYPNFWT